jgi:peroxiredoxin
LLSDDNRKSAAAQPPARPPEEGDPAPRIVAEDQDGAPAFSHADDIAGKPLVLLFAPADAADLPRDLLADLRARQSELAALEATVFVVSRLPAEASRAARQTLGLSFRFLPDATGGIYRAYGADVAAPTAIVLDPAHRVARILRGRAPDGLVDELLGWLDRAFGAGRNTLPTHAPVLLLPRVLSEADCAGLIGTWQRSVSVWPSDGFRSKGHDLERGDFKVRHEGSYGTMIEYVVREPALQQFLDGCFNRRVLPEMRKAFQTGVSRREPWRILRYEASAGGVLHPHRDNPTPETQHRRFTMTINLNAGEYEGGALRFREYDDRLYAVERGSAVVWSAALLHEVTPVTSGARYVLGVHMFGN